MSNALCDAALVGQQSPRYRGNDHGERDVDQEDARPPERAHQAGRRARARASVRPTPTARCSRAPTLGGSQETSCETSAGPAANSIEAPTACSTREATSASIEPEAAHAAEPSPNTSSPPTYSRLRPQTSPSRPIGRSSEAEREQVGRGDPADRREALRNSAAIAGSAMLTMLESSGARNVPMTSTIRTAVGFCSPGEHVVASS